LTVEITNKSIVFSPVFWRSKTGKWALKYKDENSYVKGYKYNYLDEVCNKLLEELYLEKNDVVEK